MIVISRSNSKPIRPLQSVLDTFTHLVTQTYDDYVLPAQLYTIEMLLAAVLEFLFFFQVDASASRIQQSQGTELAWILQYRNQFTLSSFYADSISLQIIAVVSVSLLVALNLVCLLAVHTKLITKRPFLLLTVYLFKLTKAFALLVSQVLGSSLLSSESLALKFLSGITLATLFLLLLIYSRFYFSPLHGKSTNYLYCMSSDFEVYCTTSRTMRVLLLISYGRDPAVCAILFAMESVGLWIYRIRVGKPKAIALANFPSQVVALTSGLLALSEILVNAISLVNLWLFGILVLVFNLLLQTFEASNSQVRPFDCDKLNLDSLTRVVAYLDGLTSLSSETRCQQQVSFALHHSVICKSKHCVLRTQNQLVSSWFKQKTRDTDNITNLINEFTKALLKSYSSKYETASLLYLLFLFEHKYYTEMKNFIPSTKSLNAEFVVGILDSRRQHYYDDLEATDDNYAQLKSQFFRQLQILVGRLGTFVQELKAKAPSLITIETHGIACDQEFRKLKKTVAKLTFNERLDFEVSQFYLEFLSHVLGDNREAELVEQSVKAKALWKSELRKMSDSTAAIMEFSVGEQQLIDINMEAIKMFNYHKIQMIDRPLKKFLLPEINCRTDTDFKELENQLLYAFALTREKACVPLRMRFRRHPNQRRGFVELVPFKKIRQSCLLMVDEDCDLLGATDTVILLACGEQVEVKHILEEYIKQFYQQLRKAGSILIDYSQYLSLHLELMRTAEQTVDCVLVQFRKSISTKSSKHQHRRQGMTSHKILCLGPDEGDVKKAERDVFWFSFCRPSKRQRFEYFGEYRNSADIGSEHTQETAPQAKIQSSSRFAVLEVDYAQGIKSYRLQGDIIYNIELEDLNEQEFISTKRIKQALPQAEIAPVLSDSSKLDYSYVMKVVALATIASLVALAVLELFKHDISLSAIVSAYSKHAGIQLFELRFYRIGCLMRDASLHFATVQDLQIDWYEEVLRVFEEIRLSQTTYLFSETPRYFSYDFIGYEGGLDRILNYMLSYIYQYAQERDLTQTERFHSKLTSQLNPWIEAEKLALKQQVEDGIDSLQAQNIVVLIAKVLLLILIAAALACLNELQINKRKDILLSYRLTSDNQFECLINRLKACEYFLNIRTRVEDYEIFNSLKPEILYPPRQIPKTYRSQHFLAKKSLYVLAAFVLLSIIGMAQISYTTSQSLSNMIDVSQTDEAIVNSYLGYLYLSIDIENGASEDKLEAIASAIRLMQVRRGIYPYSQETADFVHTLYFADSCQIAKSVVSSFLDCQRFAPNFLIENPFKQGLAFYFQQMHYYLRENVTMTFPSTGLSARPFHQIFSLLVNRTLQEWQVNVQNFKTVEQNCVILDVSVAVVFALALFITLEINKDKITQTKAIAELLAYRESNKQISQKNTIQRTNRIMDILVQ